MHDGKKIHKQDAEISFASGVVFWSCAAIFFLSRFSTTHRLPPCGALHLFTIIICKYKEKILNKRNYLFLGVKVFQVIYLFLIILKKKLTKLAEAN